MFILQQNFHLIDMNQNNPLYLFKNVINFYLIKIDMNRGMKPGVSQAVPDAFPERRALMPVWGGLPCRPCVGSSFGGNRRKRFCGKMLQLIRIFRFAPTTAASAAMLGKAAAAGFAPTKSLRSRNPSRKRQNPCRLFRRRYAYRFADWRLGAPDTRVLPPPL